MWLFNYILCLNLTEIPEDTPEEIRTAIILNYFKNSRIQYFLASFFIGAFNSGLLFILSRKNNFQDNMNLIRLVRQV